MALVTRFSQRARWAEGQPISQLMSRALADPTLTSLAAGFVDHQTLPLEPTRQALDSLMTQSVSALAALQYGTTPGLPALRQAILDRFLAQNARCRDVSIDQVVITSGSNQLLHLVSESLLDVGDIVLCAAPTYLVFLGTLGNLGARPIGVAIDEHGMVPEALNDRLCYLDKIGKLPKVKAIYVVPYFDNPCGVTMPLERKARIVQIAKRWSRSHRIHVIADAAYRELRYTNDEVPSAWTVDEEGDTVVIAGTFSKSFSPGVRIGWGILPGHLVGPVCNQKGNIDFGSPNFNQHLMARVMELGLFDPHLQKIRLSYQQKLEAMLMALTEHMSGIPGVHWRRPSGGLYVWLQLPEGIRAGSGGPLLQMALDEGVLYVPGQFCYPPEGEAMQMNRIRLSFGVQSAAKIRQGIASLGRAIRQVAACRV